MNINYLDSVHGGTFDKTCRAFDTQWRLCGLTTELSIVNRFHYC